MNKKDVVRRDGPVAKRTTHDRRVSADIGYRVWNPFEAELRTDAGGRQDEVVKSFARAMDAFER
jgi:hypothetical protein